MKKFKVITITVLIVLALTLLLCACTPGKDAVRKKYELAGFAYDNISANTLGLSSEDVEYVFAAHRDASEDGSVAAAAQRAAGGGLVLVGQRQAHVVDAVAVNPQRTGGCRRDYLVFVFIACAVHTREEIHFLLGALQSPIQAIPVRELDLPALLVFAQADVQFQPGSAAPA